MHDENLGSWLGLSGLGLPGPVCGDGPGVIQLGLPFQGDRSVRFVHKRVAEVVKTFEPTFKSEFLVNS